MKQLSRSLSVFVGRFQPLHKGHLEVIKNLSKEGKFVIILGSIQESSTRDNPFTFSERKEMIKRALKAEGIKNFKILGLPDVNDDRLWAENITRLLKTENIVVYTRNNWPKRCFGMVGVKVIKHPFYFGISSTKIRSRIRKGLEWKSLVPKEVFRYMREIYGEERIINPVI